jgi:hypothetical protein
MIARKRRLIIVALGLALLGLAGYGVYERWPEQDALLTTEQNETPDPIEPESYHACGCGCCPGGPGPLDICLYRSQGDSLTAVMEEDRNMAMSPDCAFVGCTSGTWYRYCD